jgi:hypothetical protein
LNKKIFIVTVLVIATVLSTGSVLFPGSVQEAQANPCSGNSGTVLSGSGAIECQFAGELPNDDVCNMLGLSVDVDVDTDVNAECLDADDIEVTSP